MKRLLLLPVLMFGISFACDQPYEEVAGIKIGCSAGHISDIGSFQKAQRGNPWLDSYIKVLPDGDFFDGLMITLSGSEVVGVELIKGEAIKSQDVLDLSKKMQERWGNITPIKDSLFMGWSISPQSSPALDGGAIELKVSYEDKVTVLSYITKKMAAADNYKPIQSNQRPKEDNRFKGL